VRWLDQPASTIVARWPAVRFSIGQLHHVRLGVTHKTLANHRANVRAALRWYGAERGVPRRGAPLSPAWERFVAKLEKRARRRLYNLARYFSARGIAPASVTDALFEEYWRYRTQTTDLKHLNTKKRFIARTWNACGRLPRRRCGG
jgi:hypothetical protein